MRNEEIDKIDFFKYKLELSSLSVYRNLLNCNVFQNLKYLLDYFSCDDFNDLNKAVNLYASFYFTLVEENSSVSFKEYILGNILYDENSFSRASSFKEFSKLNSEFIKAAKNDLNVLEHISSISSSLLKSFMIQSLSLDCFTEDIVNKLPDWDISKNCDIDTEGFSNNSIEKKPNVLSNSNWSDSLEALSKFHFQNGCGIFAKFNAFIWEKSNATAILRGIENPDTIRLSDFIEYELERNEVINNTLKFLNNLPANNVLLYGDRGTGKSSTVKAILNEYYCQGLRIVEVPKNRLIDFPEIIKILRNRRQKFIIFVDDLAFEDNEENYTALKAVLEGGIEDKPQNVIIYATSNRRHLIKEKFSDRNGILSSNPDDEVRAYDSIQEKLSLADRFGITVIFSSPDKKRYLEIVEGLALKRDLKFDKEYLCKEAMKWELLYNGRSPRTAKQFVDYLEGEYKQNP